MNQLRVALFVSLVFLGSLARAATVVTDILLIDNDTKAVLKSMPNQATIFANSLPTQNVSLQANIYSTTGVSKVVFVLDEKTVTEATTPYFACGDYKECAALTVPGTHTLTVTPYNSSGVVGTATKITFTTTTRTLKYLSKLGAKCDGVTDDSIAVREAVLDASHGAFSLVVDCPAYLNIGVNVDRPIFIDDNTHVTFQGAGKFIVNNMFIPAFVLANTSNITLEHWRVVYSAKWSTTMPVGYPLDFNTTYYQEDVNGKVTNVTAVLPSAQFSDVNLKAWLGNRVTKSDNVIFPSWYKPFMPGPVNVGATFYFSGDTSNVYISDLRLSAAVLTDPQQFVPFVSEFIPNYKKGASAVANTDGETSNSTTASKLFAVPTNINFTEVTLDGALMGFQGNLQNSNFINITELHYSDLQDKNGDTIGGTGSNFPPPHLFYLNYVYSGDPALFNKNILVRNVSDSVAANNLSFHVGKYRNSGGGYADSFKFGCNTCTVDQYQTNRADGFLDLLSGSNVTISNVTAHYNSFLQNSGTAQHWPGMRFPGGGTPVFFNNISFSNINMTDLAPVTEAGPVGNTTGNPFNFINVKVMVQKWGPAASIVPTIKGAASGSSIEFIMENDPTHPVYFKP